MSLLSSFTGGLSRAQVEDEIAAVGAGARGYVETIDPRLCTAATWTLANAAIGARLPRVAEDLALPNLGIFVGTASGNIDLGAYTHDGAGTFTRVASTGSTAAAGSNVRQAIAVADLVYDAESDLWLFAAADNTTLAVGRFSALGAMANLDSRVVTKISSFPLPATISATTATGFVPYLYGGA